MAPSAARRAATAAVRYATATARSTAAAALPRAAVIRHAYSSVAAGSAATPSPAVAIRHGPSSVVASSAATPSSTVAIRHASSSATLSPAVAIRHGPSFVAAGSAATRSSSVAIRLASRSTVAVDPTGNTAAARFGFPSGRLTRATPPTGVRFMHVLVGRQIDPHLQIELCQLDARSFCRYKEIAEALQLLGQKLADEEVATLQYMTEQVIHVGTVSWRVCTTVLTVAVAAGIGVLQLSKSEWESEFHDAACSLMTSRLAETRLELDEHMVKGITHRRSVAAAKAFLQNEKLKEKTLQLAEREAALVAREAALVAREAAFVAKRPSWRERLHLWQSSLS